MSGMLIKRPMSHYLYFAFLGIAIAIVGFIPTYFGPLATGSEKFSWIMHVHGLFGALWLTTYLIQTWMININQKRLHMRIGYIAVFIAVGVVVTLQMVAFDAVNIGVSKGKDVIPNILGPILDSIAFAFLFGAAIYFRKKSEVHKRLMLLATILVLWVAWVRLRHYFPPFPGAFNFFGFFLGMMPIPIIWIVEYLKTRKIHYVMLYGGVAVIAEQGFQILFYDSHYWRMTSNAIYDYLS